MISKYKIMSCIGLFLASQFTWASELLTDEVMANTTFEKLLKVSPNDADEYVQLQQDLNKLNVVLIRVKETHSLNIKNLNDYQKSSINEYNRNEKYILFNQIEGAKHKKLINESGYELQQVRNKLHIASNRSRELEDEIESLYTQKYAVKDDVLIDKLLRGELVVLTDTQEKLVVDTLISFKMAPTKFVTLLEHPNVDRLLPFYLKEQLKIFNEGNIPLIDALSNDKVMDAVVVKLQAINFINEQAVTEIVGRVYSIKEASEDFDGETQTVLVKSHLTAGTVNPLNAIELYDVPIPTEELVNRLSGLTESNMNFQQLKSVSVDK